MIRGFWRAGGVFLLGLSALTITGASGAQPAKKPPAAALDPKALELFNEGRALMESQDYAAACAKFEESLRVQRGIGTLYKLGECQEKLGKLASAWSTFSDVATAADEAGQPDRAKAARDKAKEIAPKLSKLRIVVLAEADGPDLEVQKDGVLLSRVLWGKEVPIDPGEHTVTATAPGRAPWSKVLTIKGPSEMLTVEVPALEPARAAGAAGATGAAGGLGGGGDAPAPAPAPEKRSIVPAIALGGVAAASLGAGLAMFLVSSSKISEGEGITKEILAANGTCAGASPHPRCGELDSLKSTVSTLDGLTIGAAALGVLAVGGVVVYLVLPSPEPSRPGSALRVRVAPVAGPGAGGFVASGSF